MDLLEFTETMRDVEDRKLAKVAIFCLMTLVFTVLAYVYL